MSAKVLQNDALLRALKGEATPHVPVWIMRQAGRYLPEYRKTREKAGDFLSLCKQPELACEVSVQPVVRYPLDAAIIFSDILVIPDAMGLGLSFQEGEGPVFAKPIDAIADIDALGKADTESLDYVYQAITMLASELNGRIPLIGFAGSPWTLASYMIEGRSSASFMKTKALMFNHPQALEKLLDILARSIADHLTQQVQAGADCVMIFDSWGGMLAEQEYLRFSLAPVHKIVQQFRANCADVPIILFTKGGGAWLEAMVDTGVDALGLDWMTSLADARARVDALTPKVPCGHRIALQGNLDPCALFADEEVLRAQVRRTLDEAGDGAYVFNLGHGVDQHTDPERVAALVDEVHTHQPADPA